MRAARAFLEFQAASHWRYALAGTLRDEALHIEDTQAAIWLATSSVRVAATCFTLAGGSALYETSPLHGGCATFTPRRNTPLHGNDITQAWASCLSPRARRPFTANGRQHVVSGTAPSSRAVIVKPEQALRDYLSVADARRSSPALTAMLIPREAGTVPCSTARTGRSLFNHK